LIFVDLWKHEFLVFKVERRHSILLALVLILARAPDDLELLFGEQHGEDATLHLRLFIQVSNFFQELFLVLVVLVVDILQIAFQRLDFLLLFLHELLVVLQLVFLYPLHNRFVLRRGPFCSYPSLLLHQRFTDTVDSLNLLRLCVDVFGYEMLCLQHSDLILQPNSLVLLLGQLLLL